MKRVKRQPSRFGAVDLADELGREFNLPLERLSEKFSFEDATNTARKNPALMYGRRIERMFEYVVASLGQADLITAEDSGAALYAGVEVQAPDYFVSLKSGEKYFVEVKNTQPKNLHTPVTFGFAYLSRLKNYAMRKGHPLLIAVYWNGLRRWTINKVEDFESAKGTINLRFVDAMQRSIAGDFGDRTVAAVPPLVCRIQADPDRPSLMRDNNQAIFTISGLSFFSEGREILIEKEKQIAFYLMFHSDWEEEMPVATMNGERIEYVEIEARQANEKHSGQEFEALGTLAGMISGYYKWLTTANDEIVRLTPQLDPSELAPGFDDAYRGEVLRLWQFKIQPNYEPLIRLTADKREAV
ncbi:hypothetical protein LMG31506_05449 [Cupriavidus yeoncheonensis]|uniref:Restriction endonuclease n=1 Tax=Cupriavidus yeoncheonensis TaxID=1462994 RepID=A0A916J0J5_9BURK|nr:hypothetical protein [Cupriavidus yeoncheonensis]CAG2155551.1 hypothetical protein LMG31506_05449 [Cupriavidus yeoncheonensis]